MDRSSLLVVLGVMVSVALVSAQLTPTTETIVSDRGLWPQEVTVQIALDVPVVVNGKSSGAMHLPAGRTFPLRTVTADNVTIEAGGSTLQVPIADTDLVARAILLVKQRAIAPPPPAPAPTANPPAPRKTGFSTPAPTPKTVSKVTREISGNLVALDGKKLSRFNSSLLNGKKYFAIYYSASWCGPCRAFTPKLAEWYKQNRGKSDAFEVIFVSRDRSEADMKDYMIKDAMEWPAIDYSKLKQCDFLEGFAGPGIPCLVILDENGAVVSDSYVDGNYVGPSRVLVDLEKLITKKDP